MLTGYKILAITHRTARLQELAHLVVPHENEAELQAKLAAIQVHFRLAEFQYLSTCNRVMCLLHTQETINDAWVKRFAQALNPNMPPEVLGRLDELVEVYEGEAAIQHLFSVAASVDSLVVGEREILRQLRSAYKQCREWGLTGDNIRLAMRFAVEAAKDVYANTRIGERPLSIVALAIQKLLAADMPKDARMLVIGAGQTNRLVAKFLAKHGFNCVSVFNRTLSRAEEVASIAGGRAYPLSHLPNYDKGFDCLIVCTGATTALLTADLYAQLLRGETTKKLVIDLAVPNNVAPEVAQQAAVEYIEIEGLRELAKENFAFREQEAGKATELLTTHLTVFGQNCQQRSIERAMQAVPTEMKAIKAHAINKVFRKELDELDAEARELVERMMDYMEKRCISIPMKAARETAVNPPQ